MKVVFMKRKSVLVLIVSLFLMTMVVGVVVAERVSGVEYYHTDGGTKFINHNSYTVTVAYSWGGFGNTKTAQINLGPGASGFVDWEVKITMVFRP
jgi:hypothetical protein